MEIKGNQNAPAFGAKIGMIEPCLIKDHSVGVVKSILDSIPRLKTIGDDTVEFSMKDDKTGGYSNGFFEILCKKQLGDTPNLIEPKTKIGKLWNKIFPPKAPQPNFAEDHCYVDYFDASADLIFKRADELYNKSSIQDAIKKFELEEKARELGVIK